MSSLENHPLERPPPGQISNFMNPQDRGQAITILCSVFLSIMWIFYLLRIYSKLWVVRAVGWEDASATLAAVGTTSYATLSIRVMRVLGPHSWNVRAVDFGSRLIQLDTVTRLVYNPTMFFAKLALLLLYFRIFSSNRRTRIAIYLGIIIGCLFYTSAVIVVLVMCVPRRGVQWGSRQFVAQCKPVTNMGYVEGIFGVVSDLYIFILPLPVLWTLQMPLKKKLGITTIFITGLMYSLAYPVIDLDHGQIHLIITTKNLANMFLRAIVASALGLYYRVILALDNSDESWRQPPMLGLTTVELAVGVICSSVPHLPHLFRHHTAFFSRVNYLLHRLLSICKIRPRNTTNLPHPNMSSSNPKVSEPQKLKVETRILGSIQGDGHFIEPGRLSGFLGSKPATVPSGSATFVDGDVATRRNYYETANSDQQGNDLGTTTGAGSSDTPHGPLQCRMEPTLHTASEARSARNGYWDLMSIFRSGNRNSTSQSRSYTRSHSRQI